MSSEITNVCEYEELAKQRLPKMTYDYYASGAGDQWTLKENREAFSRILLRPHILIDVSNIDLTTTILGYKITMPIMIAPSAMQKTAHPEGEYATARAASAAGTIMTLASWASSSVEEVNSTGPGIRFFQLYVYKDRSIVTQLVRKAERAGFKAIVLTVDSPRLGKREADIKNRTGAGNMSSEITNVSEYEELAKQRLPKMIYDYYASGAGDQWTLKENREAFSRILLRPRILIDVSNIDLTTTILGYKITMPIMIAPSAMQKTAHPEGEYATARAASAAGTIMTLASWASSSVEEVNSTGPGIRFFQLYVYKDRSIVTQLVRKAERAGFKAIVLTVDSPRLGKKEADIKNRFTLPPHLTLKNFEDLNLGKMGKTADFRLAYVARQVDGSLSWKDVKWLQTITPMPIIVKGVMTAEDTKLAVQAGVAGIIVSNHGARQLDYLPATITCLEEVVKAAQGRVPVFLDGGIRRGSDVFKALALGAAGVFIGRPVLFSLAVDGEIGVRKVLQMLKDELEFTMALSGCTSLKEITRNRVMTERERLQAVSRL